MSFAELQGRMKEQLQRRGYMPTDEAECVYRLMEEVGEVAEALREEQPEEALASEIVDVCWQAMRLALLKNIDLDVAFASKLAHNETRDNEGVKVNNPKVKEALDKVRGVPATLEVDEYGEVSLDLPSVSDILLFRFEEGTPEATMKAAVDALNKAGIAKLPWA